MIDDDEMLREGGIRGGGVSELETLPYASEEPSSDIVEMHGAGQPRGGYYHCMASDCSFKTRKKSSMARHSSLKNKHGMGSSKATESSSAMGSMQG